ncbi:MAG: twin-arginine translocase subunit TatC [Deltaproteobacteria bacterium]|nr:twin-arginine translocase subunit TatC [Deltaproteobacteria bacterium]
MNGELPELEAKAGILEHLTQLRVCLIRSFMALLASLVVTLYFSKQIYSLLERPMLKALPSGSSFIVTGPVEAITSYLKVSLIAGIFLASPFVFYQIWKFVAPGLYNRERKGAIGFVLTASLLFIGGASFGYFVVFPAGFPFFVSILEGTGIQYFPRMESYLDFTVKLLLGFGLAFLFPLFLFVLAKIGLVTPQQLSKARRYVVVLVFLLAGLLTPGPDILSQCLLAIPLLALYEIALLVIRFLWVKHP